MYSTRSTSIKKYKLCMKTDKTTHHQTDYQASPMPLGLEEELVTP